MILNYTAKIAKRLFPVLMLACMGRDGFAQTPESRALVHSLPYNHTLGSMFANPVLKPYEHGEAFSSVEAGWDGSDDGCRGVFDASAYMPLKGVRADATVWGDASYGNGWLRPDGTIESADYDIVRPYALADTVGGRMSAERYAFGGGYATRGRLAWGVSGSYVHRFRIATVILARATCAARLTSPPVARSVWARGMSWPRACRCGVTGSRVPSCL